METIPRCDYKPRIRRVDRFRLNERDAAAVIRDVKSLPFKDEIRFVFTIDLVATKIDTLLHDTAVFVNLANSFTAPVVHTDAVGLEVEAEARREFVD